MCGTRRVKKDGEMQLADSVPNEPEAVTRQPNQWIFTYNTSSNGEKGQWGEEVPHQVAQNREPRPQASEPEEANDVPSQVLVAEDSSRMEVVDLEADPLLQLGRKVGPASNQGRVDPDFFSLPPTVGQGEIDQLVSDMTAAWRQLQQVVSDQWVAAQAGQVVADDIPDEQYMQDLLAKLPDPESFKAGRLHQRWPVLAAFMKLTGNTSANAKLVVKAMKEGLKLGWVEVQAPGQQHTPQWKKKQQIVHQMLSRAVGEERVQQMLLGNRPQSVTFPNHASAIKYSEFVRADIAAACSKGVIKPWAAPEPPDRKSVV